MRRYIPIHEEILLHAATGPDDVAVVHGGEILTYGNLEACSSSLAAMLGDFGIGPGHCVGIYLEPSLRMAVSLLAVLKSGAAYIPLSIAFPEERIKFILGDAGAGLLISNPELPQPCGLEKTKIFFPDWDFVTNPKQQRKCEAAHPGPADLAYILYTSGSTGNPKGVMIEHGNLSYYVHWFREIIMPQTGVALPLTSSFIFAAAVTQFYSTLLDGRTLHILDPMLIRQPAALMEWYSCHPGHGIYCVPTLWSGILGFLKSADGRVPGMNPPPVVYLSGEAVPDEMIEATFNCLPQSQLWNLYGPTEATANITACRLYPGDTSHIGPPLDGTRVFIVDENLEPVEQGEAGELLACGEGIARGYVNLPELSASTFIHLRMNRDENLRLYRSGDLVREEAPGKLKFIGRKDQQVKIRGYRVELPEIEHALSAVPLVKHAAVRAIENGSESKTLVACIMFHENETMSVQQLRFILGRTLPDFMIPERFIILDRFPLLPNGKTDRRSLPEPGPERPGLGYPAVSAVTAREKTMVRIWEEVLGLEGIGMEDNFFELGGNSLKANALSIEIRSRMETQVSLRAIFENPTPAGLLQHAVTREGAGEVTKEMPAVESPAPGIMETTGTEASENQKALWFLQHAEPELCAYNIFYSVCLDGQLDVDCLGRVLERIIEVNPCLTSAFLPGADSPVEKSLPVKGSKAREIITVITGQTISREDAVELARLEASKPFDLGKGFPFRFILYRTGQDSHFLAVVIHHIVFDGLSFGNFLSQLREFYDEAQAGLRNTGSHRMAGISGFAIEERAYLESAGYQSDRLYWKNLLDGVSTFYELPTDFVRPEGMSQAGGQVRTKIDPALMKRLKAFSDSSGASMFMTCLAAFSVLLYRHSGRLDFLIATPVANRNSRNSLGYLGYFVNTMLFRTGIDPTLPFAGWLGRLKEQTLESLSHSRFPLNHLTGLIRTDRIPGINPFFQVMFAYHETGWDFTASGPLKIKGSEEFTGFSKFDLYAEFFSSRSETELVFTYSAALYRRETMEVLANHLLQLLSSVCHTAGDPLYGLSMMARPEYEKVVYGWNSTMHPLPRGKTLPGMILEQICISPDNIALVSRTTSYTYREMGEKASMFAAALMKLGVKKSDPVGIHLENSPDMVLCILALFMAGAVYIPLDPYYPEERLRYVIEKTGTKLLISGEDRSEGRDRFPARFVSPGNLMKLSGPLGEARCSCSPHDVAYIMFTSGSTGNPKGVVIRHDSLLNFLLWMKDELAFGPSDSFLSTTSINFDISLLELFTPLISGARLVLEKRSELQAPEKVEAILNEMTVNTVQFVPSGWKALCDTGVPSRVKSLKTMISGGEKLSKNLQELLFAQSSASLLNLYGPTEATVYMAFWRCERNSRLRMVPIGRPVYNAAFYILDGDLKPVPVGVTGEAWLGGNILAEGYFDDELQTASRFLPDPFSGIPGARMYRAGDLCRFLADGAIEFLGRTDHQVKVRGFRIEPGEVESTILRFKSVSRVIVNAQEHGEDDIRLTAFLVPSGPEGVDEYALKEFLRLHLPAYMIPGHFITAPAIPTLPNGKTDYKSLLKMRPPAPVLPRFVREKMNETEEQLKDIWKDLLGHEAFSATDNFFEVGGHSLLLVRMKDQIAEKMNEEVSIVDLFHYPAIRSISVFLRKEHSGHDYSDIEKRVASRNKSIRQQVSKRLFRGKNE